MIRILTALLVSLFALSACDLPGTTTGDGASGVTVYRINKRIERKIPGNVLEAVNSLRAAKGLDPVELSPELTVAARRHSADMAKQNRPWHWGSDGSSPIDRVADAGFSGRFLGENISETYEDELLTVAAWVEEAETRDVILNPDAKFMGISWYQEPTGKLWWTQVFGG